MGQCIYFRAFTHIIEFLMNIWWQLILIRSQIIIWSYKCDQNWWNIIKKNRYEFSSAFIFMSKSTHDFWLCVMFFVGRLFLRELHFIYKNKLYMFLIVKAFATSLILQYSSSKKENFNFWHELRELSSTKTRSDPHEFLCRSNCSACADYQPW